MSHSHPIPAPPTAPNFFVADRSLQKRLRRLLDPHTYAWAEPLLTEVGEVAGGEADRLAAVADKHRPVLQVRDARGDRTDQVVFHPAYIELSRLGYERLGLAAMVHTPGYRERVAPAGAARCNGVPYAPGQPAPAPQVVGTAAQYLFAQAEQGLICPIIMTDCLVRALRKWASPDLQARFIPRLTATAYERLWEGAMFITERPGGSDVGANETLALPAGDGTYELHGEKWFCSNVSAGLVLVTARPDHAPPGIRGIGAFLMPARLEDGSRNHYRIERLKDKLGTWSMASGEVTLEGALAYPIGPLERGWHVAAEMVNATRLMVAMGCAAAMRRACFAARHHAAGRAAFGRPVDQHPMMQQTLLDLAVETEAAQALMLEVARAFDEHGNGQGLCRILTPLGKYWNAEQATPAVRTAMQILGGIGYLEEWVTARLFRDVQVNQIWEGTPNIIALDLLRTAEKDGTLTALLQHLVGRLADLRSPQLRPLARTLSEGAAGLGQDFKRAAALGRTALQLAAHKLIGRLACLTIATLFAEEADHDLLEERDRRGLALAEAFLRRRLPDLAAAAGISTAPWDDHDLKVFPAVVDHLRLPV